MQTLASNISSLRLPNEPKSRPPAHKRHPSTCPRGQGDLIVQGKAPPASTNSASLTDLPPTFWDFEKSILASFARGAVQGSGEEREQAEEAFAAADLSILITGEGSCAKEPGQLETPDS